MEQAAVLPQPCACMGEAGVPQHEGLTGRRFVLCQRNPTEEWVPPWAEATRTPSTTEQTGVSVNSPGAWAARIRAARPNARMERMRSASYTMGRNRSMDVSQGDSMTEVSIRKVVVIGAGIMGRGIALASARAGFATSVIEPNAAMIQTAKAENDKVLARAREKNEIDE